MEINGYVNSLVPDVLWNIVFCVQQRKETHTGSEQVDGLIEVKEECQEVEQHEEPHGEQSCSRSQNGKSQSQETCQRTEAKNPFSCCQCGKSFTRKGHLKIHTIIHTGERPYTCPQCTKRFTCKGSLKDHFRIHSGERPFTCPQCGWSFTRHEDLKRHIRIHSGEKPFKCSHCEKSVTQTGALKIHERFHTGEKPYLCPSCGKTFSRYGNLGKHLKKACPKLRQ